MIVRMGLVNLNLVTKKNLFFKFEIIMTVNRGEKIL